MDLTDPEAAAAFFEFVIIENMKQLQLTSLLKPQKKIGNLFTLETLLKPLTEDCAEF